MQKNCSVKLSKLVQKKQSLCPIKNSDQFRYIVIDVIITVNKLRITSLENFILIPLYIYLTTVQHYSLT
jgi:hypothetical protein